ncbi:MAG: DUF1801 domain-containing protein [Anaerolineales bacterium]|jgi:hypothetical protein
MRLSNKEIQKYLNHYPVEMQEIFMGVRDLVFEVVPAAWERHKMNGIAYFLQEDSSPLKGMICHVVTTPECVEIGFIFGALMPDQAGLLVGNQKAKRRVYLEDYEQVPWEELKGLLRAAADIDPATF